MISRSRQMLLMAVVLLAGRLHAEGNTIGLLMNDSTSSFSGYTLFAPGQARTTYLISQDGQLVHSWISTRFPGQAAMLLPNGHLLRTANAGVGLPFGAGGAGGIVEEFDWQGNPVWTYHHHSNLYRTHHDIEWLSNGNVLLISWELKSRLQAIAAGRNPAFLPDVQVWPEVIIEVQPTGDTSGVIVWQWHVWDHLIQDYDPAKANYGTVADHPELLDINFGDHHNDWLHANAVRFNPERNEIMISVRNVSEFWVVDHSTTTQEAAGHTGGLRGHGGDLLYRWGNPQTYRLGTAADQKLFVQHDARWITPGLPGEGHVLVFNNGTGRPGGNYSSVDELVLPLAEDGSYYRAAGAPFGPMSLYWTYAPQDSDMFYAEIISGATHQPNGNTLICAGTYGEFFEVTASGRKVWDYINPVTSNGIAYQGGTALANMVFKIYRYAPDFPGFAGRDLTPLGPIEHPLVNDLTIRIIGSDVTLRWTYDPGSFHFSIYDDVTATGSFATLVGTTTSTTLTIPGAVNVSQQRFYLVKVGP